ncbi:hypothetical protein G6F32_013789 [Rhizopus arrhizus]|nr:hypothetical protein G6F32_013789 [Rhizopus arrhizus]
MAYRSDGPWTATVQPGQTGELSWPVGASGQGNGAALARRPVFVPSAGSSVRQQGRGELVRHDRLQGFQAFAHADPVDRNRAHALAARRDRCQRAALGGAVQLGHHQAGHVHRGIELAQLRQRVLAGGAIDHHQHFVRGGGVDLAEHAADLAQFGRQPGLGVQAAGGVGDQHRGAAVLAGLQRIECHRCGIGVLPLGDHGHAVALAPGLPLGHGGGAEGIAGGQQQAGGQLPTRLW